MAQTKTDNSHLEDKVNLRINHLPPGDLRVLDCYSGKGTIWRTIKKRTGRNIKTLPIDVRKDIGFHLAGDNLDFLTTLDLSRFDVIDLDAYGVPYAQLKILFERQFGGMVFVTMIYAHMGQLPHGMLEEIGFTKEMIKKSPTLFCIHGWDYFKQWLAMNGVKDIFFYELADNYFKHYLCFRTGARDC